MNKIYTSSIKQYSIEGNLLNTFSSVKEASLIYSNYDSIIKCCKGIYKTAGGFIWRFEQDNFKFIKEDKKDLICFICKSNETIRSMAMHLKWTHNITTKEYISQYGEFRPKHIKENEIKTQSNIKCKICDKKMKHNRQLMYHITKYHKDITHFDYIIKYMFENNHPKCKCGCGKDVTILKEGRNNDLNKDSYCRDYIKGHIDWDFNSYNHQSKGELEVYNFIKQFYKGEILTSVKNIIRNRELDIFIPEKNIAIEYNGLYWHSSKINPDKNYHLNKTLECKSKNIRLIQIFEDEWNNKRDIVKSKLLSILGMNSFPKIYARKCIIKEIDAETKNKFLDKTHIQGKDKSKIKLGLFFKDELVACMTFSSPRIFMNGINTPNKYELSRYSTSKNIIGGASKLLKFFIKNFNPKYIYSYSDNRWSDLDNNMYSKIGFTKEKLSPPGYFYTKDFIRRIHRFNFSKQNLIKMGINVENKTEFEIMDTLGYYRIWDCGVTKYSLILE